MYCNFKVFTLKQQKAFSEFSITLHNTSAWHELQCVANQYRVISAVRCDNGMLIGHSKAFRLLDFGNNF